MLAIGLDTTLVIQVLADGDTVPNANITLESEDPAIAIVDSVGNILAVGRGVATIRVKLMTAASGDAPVDTTFAVKAVIHSVTVEPADTSFPGTFFSLGDTLYVAIPRDAYDSIVSDMVIFHWSSSDTTVAQLDSLTGLVTAVGNDSAMITATAVWDSVSGSDSVVVSQIVASVEVTPDTNRPDTLTALRDTTRFIAIAKDANNRLVSNLTFVWSSFPDPIATAESTGDSTALVTAVANGEATITAETARCPFSACDPAAAPAKADSLSGMASLAGPQMADPSKGASSLRQLRAGGLKDRSMLRDPSTASTTGLSDDPARTPATADAPDPVPGSHLVWVEQKASQVDLAGPGSVEAGVMSTAFALRAQDANGYTATVSAATVFDLSSNSTGTASFYTDAGGTTAITMVTIAAGNSGVTFYYKDTKAATATVTATRTSGDALGSAPHQLTVSAGPAAQVVLTGPDSAEAGVVSGAFILTAQDAYGNRATASAVTDFDLSSNSTAATFYSNAAGDTAITTVTIAAGDSTAMFYSKDTKAGTPTVTATRVSGDPLGGATHGITVTPGPAATVVVTPEGKSLSGTGSTTMFSAEARDAFGNEISDITWSSLNPNVATVDPTTGLTTVATALRDGQVTISADVGGVTGYALLTVAVPGVEPVNLWAEMASSTAGTLVALWGASSSDVYAVGFNGQILRYNGSSWSAMSSGTGQLLLDVWGTSNSGVYALGSNGAILRYSGSAWSAIGSGTTVSLRGIWGSSSTDVHAVGDGGTILRYDGTAWAAMGSGTTALMDAVWGTSSSDIYAVGGGTILHYDGASWAAMNSGTTRLLHGVWGTSRSDVYAVGDGGTILHYDGTSWTAMTSGTIAQLLGVWGTSSSDVYAVGCGGVMLRYDGSTWSEISGASDCMRSIWGTSRSHVFVVAGPGSTGQKILRGVRGATVTVTPGSGTLTSLGAAQQLSASAQDASANTISGVTFSWTSDEETVATVDASGLVTAVADGTATITATAPGGASGNATITVSQQAAWTEDFESYTAGSFPSAWTPDGNASSSPSSNHVDNSVSYEGTNSLQLHGTIGGCWAAIAYRTLTVTPPYEVEVAIRNGTEPLSGCHPFRGVIGIRKGTSWTNPGRQFLLVNEDGSLESVGGNLDLGSIDLSAWHLIRIRYEKPSLSETRLSYWIDGTYKGFETVDSTAEEDEMTNLDLSTQEGTVWFDNIRVFQNR